MKKKIISFVIMMSVLLQMPVFVKAANDTDSNISFDTKKQLVELVTENYTLDDSSENVTRSEFLTLLLRAEGADCSGATDDAMFTDVPKDSALSGVVSAAVKRGIISEGAKFYPEEYVTYLQAVKMAVSLVGYGKRAEAEGGYPTGYSAIAYSLGLLDGIDKYSESSPLNVNDAYVLMFNAVRIDMPEVNDKGDIVSYTGEKCESILKKYHNIYELEGVVTANERTSLMSGRSESGEGYIRIGSEDYECDITEDYLGMNVKAYYEDRKEYLHGENKILVMQPYKNQTKTVLSEDFDSKDGNYLKYYSDSKTVRLKISDNIKVIKNGSIISPDSLTEFLSQPNGSFEFIDNDNNGTYDIVKAKVYKYVHVWSVDGVNGYIFDKNSSENMLDLSDSECKYTIYEQYYNGMAQIEIEDIERNSLLAYTMSEDGKYCEATVLNNSESGTISSVNGDDAVINGVTHKINDYAKKYLSVKAGKSGVFYFGIDNSLVSFSEGDTDIKYAWLASTWEDEADSSVYWVKIFGQDGKFYRNKLSKKVKLDAVTTASKDVYAKIQSVLAMSDPDRIIRYNVNKNGEINMLDTAKDVLTVGEGFSETDKSDSLRIYYRKEVNPQYKLSSGIFGRKIKINSSTVIFYIPPKSQRGDENAYEIWQNTDFKDDQRDKTITAYDINSETNVSGAILIDTENASGGSGADKRKNVNPWPDGMGVVEKKYTAVNEDNEDCYLFTIWKYDGTYAEYYSTDEVKDEAEKTDIGDIIRYEANSRGRITKLACDYDLSEDVITIDDNTSPDIYRYGSSDYEYIKGTIYSYDSGTIAMLLNNVNLENKDEIDAVQIKDLFITSLNKIVIADVSKSSGNITKVTLLNTKDQNVRTIKNSLSGADRIVVRGRYWGGIAGIIYRYN